MPGPGPKSRKSLCAAPRPLRANGQGDGRPAGVFIPWENINIEDEVRRAALKALTAELAKEREEKGITEEEVLEDFASFRKSRRGCERNSFRADRRESQ